MIPGWPYSFVAALEPGRTSWTSVLDAVRLGPDDDETEVTATQVRQVVVRLIDAGHWRHGDPDMLIVFDAGYDVTRLRGSTRSSSEEAPLGSSGRRPSAWRPRQRCAASGSTWAA